MNPNKRFLTIAVLAVALVIILGLVRGGWFGGIDRNTYQAVFLTNNQMYFGKLSNPSDPYLKLRDIYYLKNNPQAPEENEKKRSKPQISLVKFGDELQEPQDEMFINRDQVLLWENLKEGGKVIQFIQQQKLQAQAAEKAPEAPAPAAN